MTVYVSNIKSVIVRPELEPIFSEMATLIRINDEAGGCFVEVKQEGASGIGTIQLGKEEWPLIRVAIEKMFSICDEINKSTGKDE